jgi:4-hydroxy-tetrahydrodipicolinate synthase
MTGVGDDRNDSEQSTKLSRGQIRYNSIMSENIQLSGVYAAALTPLLADGRIDLDALGELLQFLAYRGCHGTLLFGTTGEGPSFSPIERTESFRYIANIRNTFPDFKLLAGTGTPSLDETIQLTKEAFEYGFDGAVVLPPYYFRKVSDEGLFEWFSLVLEKAVPHGRALLGYHIPQVSGVSLSIDLLARLKDAFPDRFVGLKDSSGDPEHAKQLGLKFGKDLIVLNGNDRLFSHALDHQASGCITALANLISPDLRLVWNANLRLEKDINTQERITACRSVMDSYPPAPPMLKYLLWRLHNFPYWAVRPPLLAINEETGRQALSEISKAMSNRLDQALP